MANVKKSTVAAEQPAVEVIEEVSAEPKVRGPKVTRVSIEYEDLPQDLQTKLATRIEKYGAEGYTEVWKTVRKDSLVYHVEIKLGDGSLVTWKSSYSPEWKGWIR